MGRRGQTPTEGSLSRGANPGTDSEFPAKCARKFMSVPGLRGCRRLGVDLRGERVIGLVNIQTTDDGLAVPGDLTRDLVAHDRFRIRDGASDGGFLNGREHLVDYLLLVPPIHALEVVNRLLAIDLFDQGASHVLVRKAEGVPGLVANYAVELRFRRIHGELF